MVVVTIPKPVKVAPIQNPKKLPPLQKKNVTRRKLKPKLCHVLKNETKEFFETTSFHGFGSILRSKNLVIRIMWILIAIFFAGYSMSSKLLFILFFCLFILFSTYLIYFLYIYIYYLLFPSHFHFDSPIL